MEDKSEDVLDVCFGTDDTVYGTKYVYCRQHCCVHSTGWCTVCVLEKIPLLSKTEDGAEAEWAIKQRTMNIQL